MPRKKPTQPLTRAEIRKMAEEVLDEHPFIRLGDIARHIEPPPTRWSQLTDAEIAALPKAEKDALIREELVAVHQALYEIAPQVGASIAELRASQSEIYARKLQP